MDYILTRMARIIVVNSQYSETVVQKIYKKSSIIIYPGINNSKKYFDGSKIKIGCISVGSLMDYKGHRKTIELISRIDISTRPPLVVIGGGKPNQITSLYNLAHKLNVNLKIKNNLSDKEVENEYKKAKIYINNAYFEPFGLAALESIIYGCILVTNNTGGTKEIKKYFPDKVKVCVDDSSMKNVLASALSEQSCSRVKIPSIFKWQRIAHKINNL